MELYSVAMSLALFYAFCVLCSAKYMTSKINVIHKIVASEDRHYYRRSNWHRQIVAFFIAALFTFVPVLNVLTTLGFLCELIGIKMNDD